jgi:hypothetical protein
MRAETEILGFVLAVLVPKRLLNQPVIPETIRRIRITNAPIRS